MSKVNMKYFCITSEGVTMYFDTAEEARVYASTMIVIDQGGFSG